MITFGEYANTLPSCSPDGQSITFLSTRSGTDCLWKISVEGGEPVQLTDKAATRASFSPDGTKIACGYFVEGAKPEWKTAIIPFAGGTPIKLLEMPVEPHSWTADGSALIYARDQNLWRQPVDGSPPVQITNFSSALLSNFAFSRDGKRVAFITRLNHRRCGAD